MVFEEIMIKRIAAFYGARKQHRIAAQWRYIKPGSAKQSCPWTKSAQAGLIASRLPAWLHKHSTYHDNWQPALPYGF